MQVKEVICKESNQRLIGATASTPGTGGGVFRPASAQGTTLVLIAAADYVTVYGQRPELECIFGADYQVVSLRTTSSAFIDAQLIYQPPDNDSVDDQNQPQQQQRNRTRSELLWRLYQQRIRSRGFVITVQTHWVRIFILFSFERLVFPLSNCINCENLALKLDF